MSFAICGPGGHARPPITPFLFAAVLVGLLADPASAADRCRNAAGTWRWFNGSTVTLSAGGSVTATGLFANQGHWRCIDRQAGRIRITWEGGGWIDTLSVSDDGSDLRGRNQYGIGVSGVLISGGQRKQAEAKPPKKASRATPPAESAPKPKQGKTIVSSPEKDAAAPTSLADLNSAIARDPHNPEAYRARGYYYLGTGDQTRAMADFEKAQQIESPQTPAAQPENTQIASLTAAIERNPRDAKAWFERANAFAKAADYDHAVADYDRALSIDPKYAGAYYNRAVVYQASGAIDRAIADYDLAIVFDPKFAAAYNNRGIARRAKRAFADAIADFETAAVLDPPNARVYLDRIIELDPKNTKALISRGQALASAGDRQGAAADFEKVLALDPGNAAAKASLANLGVKPSQ
jgi:tetratricopeptide (TPR) repeat protein